MKPRKLYFKKIKQNSSERKLKSGWVGRFIILRSSYMRWSALMAVWSKELPLTASSLSPLPMFESRLAQVRKLTATLGKAMFYTGHSSFHHRLQLAIQKLAVTWQNSDRYSKVLPEGDGGGEKLPWLSRFSVGLELYVCADEPKYISHYK